MDEPITVESRAQELQNPNSQSTTTSPVPDPFSRIGKCAACGQDFQQSVSNRDRSQYVQFSGRFPFPEHAWIPSDCVACSETKEDAKREEWRTAYAEQLERSLDSAFFSAFEKSGAPSRVLRDLDTFTPEGESLELRHTVDALINGTLGYRWLVISGTQGCGKTTEAARGILLRINDACERAKVEAEGRSPYVDGLRLFDRFTTLPSLVTRVTDTFKDGQRSKLDVLKDYLRCNFLVLDDIGTEKPTEYTVGILHEIVDRRYSDLSLTAFTTNLPTLQALGEHLARLADDTMMSHRIISRMKEMAKFVRLTIPDYRPARGKEPKDWSDIARKRERPEREPEPRREPGRMGVVI